MPDLPIKSIWRILKGMPNVGSHAQNLDIFYRPQIAGYDALRKRLLHGRKTLVDWLEPSEGARVVEIGAGTGAMIEFWGNRINRFSKFYLVDLCPAMLEMARSRSKHIPQIEVVECDATQFQLIEPVDIVYFSYSLTMIPDWEKALNQAMTLLKPGGKLGIVDFYISEKKAPSNHIQHSAFTRWFWSHWFSHDQVHLSADHLPKLHILTQPLKITESWGPLPWLPLIHAPFYIYMGQKSDAV